MFFERKPPNIPIYGNHNCKRKYGEVLNQKCKTID